MYRFVCLAIFTLVCFTGCTSEYVPPQEAIPDLPAGRGGEAGGAPAGAGMPAGKGPGAGGPSKMAKP